MAESTPDAQRQAAQDRRAAWVLAHPFLSAVAVGAAWGLGFFALDSLVGGEPTMARLLRALVVGVVFFGPCLILLMRRRVRSGR